MRRGCRKVVIDGTTRYVRGDRETWSAGIVLPNAGQSDSEALQQSGAYGYEHGPGRGFAGAPWVKRRTRTRILVSWSGGLDI